MYVRCPDCNASTWVVGTNGEPGPAFTCKRCSASYDLGRVGELGPTAEDRHARAVEFADRNGVDLASAYSMMLGLMPEPGEPEPDERAVADDPADGDRPGSVPAGHTGSDAVHYDSGFSKAVEEGLLTPEQARELGDRESSAGRLARLHQLPIALALDVVDRRVSMSEAVRQAPRVQGVAVSVPASRLQKFMVVGLGMLALVALVIFGGSRWSGLETKARMAEARTAESPASPRVAGVGFVADLEKLPEAGVAKVAAKAANLDVHTDGEGRVVRITARSPRAVLEAFCSSGVGAERYRADEVVPGAHGARLGLVRDLDDLETPMAILIRRDRGSGLWTAGNGLEPIVVADLPD